MAGAQARARGPRGAVLSGIVAATVVEEPGRKDRTRLGEGCSEGGLHLLPCPRRLGVFIRRSAGRSGRASVKSGARTIAVMATFGLVKERPLKRKLTRSVRVGHLVFKTLAVGAAPSEVVGFGQVRLLTTEHFSGIKRRFAGP